MKARNVPAREALEIPCPACGAAISTASITRRKRVQCPKCREIVELNPPEAPAETPALPAAAVLITDLQSRIERLEELEARVVALEKAVEPMAPLRFLTVDEPRPARQWRWLAPSDSHAEPAFPAEVAEALLHNLGNFDPHALTIRVAAGNERATQRAKHFKEVFERAHWTVHGPQGVPASGSEKGLFLAVRGMPLPNEAAAAYFALTASGFQLNSILDPNLKRDETILIVA